MVEGVIHQREHGVIPHWQSAKHIWKIRRYASEPDRTELTMSVRNRVVKPNDKDNQLDTTYTVTFERCSARSLSLIATKAKLP